MEIEESMVCFDSDKKIKGNRFDRETKDIQKNAPEGVTLLDATQNTWTLLIDGPADSVFAGGQFKILLLF